MNTYKKYCPNVFVARCEQQYNKGDLIKVTTKYGKENEHIIHNLLQENDGVYYYSITRADGLTAQDFAAKKAARLEGYAATRENKADQYRQASRKGADFLSLGEPIKVGHHSEGPHRRLLEHNQQAFSKAKDEEKKAAEYLSRAEYWENRKTIINLSMPESIEYFKFQLEKAEKLHADLKAGKILKDHSYALPYAKKAVNDNKKKYELAVRLWG